MTAIRVERVKRLTDELVTATDRLAVLLDSRNQVAVSAEYLERVVANSAIIWLTAHLEDNPRIVGMAFLVVFELPTNVRALLENVVVAESARQRGVGSALVARAIAEADTRGVNTIRTAVGTDNGPSSRLLTNAGFVTETGMTSLEFRIAEGPRDVSRHK